MQRYLIGDYIRELRMEMGYSQEELSDGICSPGNLSKIENNTRRPELNKLEALLQRLGRKECFTVLADKKEMDIGLLFQDLTSEIARRDVIGIENALKAMESICLPEDVLSTQYMEFAKKILDELKGVKSDEILVRLVRILGMTKKDFELGKELLKGLYTYNEIVIINAIAVKSYHLRQTEYAIGLLQDIKKYMDEKILDQEEKAKKYPMILLNLSGWLSNDRRYEEALNLCEEGLWICMTYGKLHPMPELMVTKGVILANLSKWEKAAECFKRASHLFGILDREKECQEVRCRAKKDFGIMI